MNRLPLPFVFFMTLILGGCAISDLIESVTPQNEKYRFYRDFWLKKSHPVKDKERKTDWLACGGEKDGGFYWNKKRVLPGESYEVSRPRQLSELQRCMTKKGYCYHTINPAFLANKKDYYCEEGHFFPQENITRKH